jgi:hypothetical protein
MGRMFHTTLPEIVVPKKGRDPAKAGRLWRYAIPLEWRMAFASCYRQFYDHAGAFVRDADGRDAAPMALNDLFAEGQPQSGSLNLVQIDIGETSLGCAKAGIVEDAFYHIGHSIRGIFDLTQEQVRFFRHYAYCFLFYPAREDRFSRPLEVNLLVSGL